MKVFSAKFGGMPHPPMIGFKQSVKVFSAKFSLPTDPRKFSPSKVYCYMVYIAFAGLGIGILLWLFLERGVGWLG